MNIGVWWDFFNIEESFMNKFYYVCISIDKGIYNIIAWVYNTLLDIAGYQLVSPDVVDIITRRMFIVASVVMLFVVTYSLLRGIINPDELSGSGSYSGKKVAFGIIKSLIAVLVIPACFDLAYSVQNAVLEDRIIEKVILGSNNTMDSFDYNPGFDFSIQLYHSFLYDNDHLNKASLNCNTTLDENGNEVEICDDTDTVFMNSRIYGSWTCSGIGIDMPCVLSGNTTDHIYNGEYDYLPIVGFLTGIFAAVVLIMYLLDISLRAVKLVFLEIISPIPSFMLIIPNQTKVFSSWFKETLKTFADLFVRLAVLFFCIFVIQQIFVKEELGLGVGYTSDIVVKLFLIFGVLMFMSKAPKLISSIFGIDTGYGFSFKKRWDDVKSGFKTLSEPVTKPIGKVFDKSVGVAAGVHWARKAKKAGVAARDGKKQNAFQNFSTYAGGVVNGFKGGRKHAGYAYDYEMSNQQWYSSAEYASLSGKDKFKGEIENRLRNNMEGPSLYKEREMELRLKFNREIEFLNRKIAAEEAAANAEINKINKKYDPYIKRNDEYKKAIEAIEDHCKSKVQKADSDVKTSGIVSAVYNKKTNSWDKITLSGEGNYAAIEAQNKLINEMEGLDPATKTKLIAENTKLQKSLSNKYYDNAVYSGDDVVLKNLKSNLTNIINQYSSDIVYDPSKKCKVFVDENRDTAGGYSVVGSNVQLKDLHDIIKEIDLQDITGKKQKDLVNTTVSYNYIGENGKDVPVNNEKLIVTNEKISKDRDDSKNLSEGIDTRLRALQGLKGRDDRKTIYKAKK